MSSRYASVLRRWHERAYDEMRKRRETTLDYLGRTLEIPPEVFCPTQMSDLLGRAVLAEVEETDRVLDMGTGCGVNAILAAARSEDVTAADLNPTAVECARRNVIRNGVGERVHVVESDLFSGVEGMFDLIIFDPPFRWFRPRDMLEASITDENYRSLTRFFDEVGDRLTARGRILLFFGTSGDVAYLDELIAAARLRCTVIGRRILDTSEVEIAYFVYRLTPG